jgi:hypothetical protein
MRFSATVLGLMLIIGSAGLAIAVDTNRSATPVQASGMTDAQIRQPLETQSYTNVRITEHDKSHVDVKAVTGAKPAKLKVNPRTGQASPDNVKDH